ncbi:MAG: NADH-quinone oxidoreductase subunit M, partial [Beijerinckiaceae bacterium]|nr:NADH-quinone oxidoreductase subunit M [Beijerinckiaceae bacterium]
MSSHLLSGLIVLPLIGCLFILMMKSDEAGLRNIRWIALFTTIATFILSVIAWGKFDPSSPAFQLVEESRWLADNITFKLGVDGFSMPFILLTTFLMPFCIVASWVSVEKRVKEYMIAFLVLEALMIGVFAALDLVLFYLFFEAGLIPMFLIIGIWGGKRRIYASFKFFLYTLLGSLLMLIAIMAMYWTAGTTDIVALLKYKFPVGMQTWLWLAFFSSFAVKMPMWPVHTW